MASFCTKCGSAVASEAQFCTTCGTPMGAVPIAAPGSVAGPATSAPVTPYAAVPQPPGYPPAPDPLPGYPPPAYPPSAYPAPAYPPAPPAKSGSSAVKIILIVVAVFVGLAILGGAIFAFAVWRIVRTAHVDQKSGNVTLSTPGGTFSANTSGTYSAEDLGTEIYPGAQTGRGGAKLDLPTGLMVTAIFVTSDSKQQVIDFYKSKLGSEASIFSSEDAATITLKKSDDEAVIVAITSNSSQYDGKTQISITHTRKKPS